MTTKTENLTAWEALKLLQEGEPVVIDAHGEEWYPEDLKVRLDLGLVQFVIKAPFRLANAERFATYKDIKVEDGFELAVVVSNLCELAKPAFAEVLARSIVDLIRTESRKIAQEEIAKHKLVEEADKKTSEGIKSLTKNWIGEHFGEPIESYGWSDKSQCFKRVGPDRGEPNE